MEPMKPKELHKARTCSMSAMVQIWDFSASVDARLQSNFKIQQWRSVRLRDLPHAESWAKYPHDHYDGEYIVVEQGQWVGVNENKEENQQEGERAGTGVGLGGESSGETEA